MNERIRKGFRVVGTVVQEAVKLWHIILGAIVFAATIIIWTAVYVQPASAAALTHKELKDETTEIRKEMTNVHQDMNNKITALTELIKLNTQQTNLKDVNRDLRDNDAEQYAIQNWIKVNGETVQDTRRLRDLKNEREELLLKRDCIVNKNPACDK